MSLRVFFHKRLPMPLMPAATSVSRLMLPLRCADARYYAAMLRHIAALDVTALPPKIFTPLRLMPPYYATCHACCHAAAMLRARHTRERHADLPCERRA